MKLKIVASELVIRAFLGANCKRLLEVVKKRWRTSWNSRQVVLCTYFASHITTDRSVLISMTECSSHARPQRRRLTQVGYNYPGNPRRKSSADSYEESHRHALIAAPLAPEPTCTFTCKQKMYLYVTFPFRKISLCHWEYFYFYFSIFLQEQEISTYFSTFVFLQ